VKTCSTCAWCVLVARNQGYCHGGPPQIFHARWYKATGEQRIDPRSDMWVQLIPTGPSGMWPPVHPQHGGCGKHQFSIRAWLRWRRSEPAPPQHDVAQDKA
jgi:hypothetical protein